MAIEIKSSLLNENDLKFVKNSLIAAAEQDNKDKFRVRVVEYINDSSADEDDEFFYDMIEFLRFLDPTKAGDHIAYTTPDCMIYLNCPCKQVGEVVPQWEFVFDHECMHQLWETFKVEEKIKNKHGSCEHEILNIASDCVINDYLLYYRKKKMPPVGITPEKIEEKFGVKYDRKVDTQYTLYLKLKKVVDEQRDLLKKLMDDPNFRDAMEQEAQSGGQSGSGSNKQQGNDGSGSSDSDIDKMSGEEAAKDAQKSADKANDAANKAQKEADKAKKKADKSGSEEDKKAAEDAQKAADKAKEAAKKAQEAADKAKEAAEDGDDEKAKESAKEARDKANEAANNASSDDGSEGGNSGENDDEKQKDGTNKGDESNAGVSHDGGGEHGVKSAGSGTKSGPFGETPEDLEKIRKRFNKIIDRYGHIMSGMIGDFTTKCKKAAELKEDGLRVGTINRAQNGWDKNLAISVNNFVKSRVFKMKKQWERTYKKIKRGSGFIEYGQPIMAGKRIKKQTFVINVAFYIDISGSMSDCLNNCFEAAYTIAEALKKKYKNEKVVDDVVFKMITWDDDFYDIKWGNKTRARGGTMAFHKLLNGIEKRTNDFLVNIIITDAQFTVQETEVLNFLDKINGMVNFITNHDTPVIKQIAEKKKNKLYYLLADSKFVLDKNIDLKY